MIVPEIPFPIRSLPHSVALALVACVVLTGPLTASADPASASPADAVVDERAIDAAMPACTNFYRHACGGFLRSARVDARIPRIGLFEQRFDDNLRRALDGIFATAGDDDPELSRLETFLASCRAASRTTQAEDLELLTSWFDRIDAVRDRRALQRLTLELDAIGVEPFFVYDAAPDPADWSRWHGDLGVPVLHARAATVAAAFVASGWTEDAAEHAAARVEAIALRLRDARNAAGDAEPQERTWREIEALAPTIDWPRYRAQVGARTARRVTVTAPAYVAEVAKVLDTTPIEDLKAYLRWRMLLALRGELPPAYARALAMLPVSLRGSVNDVEARCRDATIRAMGVAFSRQFSLRVLGPQARTAAQRLAETIRARAIAELSAARWLSDAARAATEHKLRRLDLQIGFPDRWPATGEYALSRSHFLANVLAAWRFEQSEKWRRTGERRERALWQEKVYPWVGDGMASARLALPNGFPDAYSNSLVMTAAFLVPPRFAASAPAEANYATFGTVFAHELAHVLELHMFGADGRTAELWSAPDVAKHDALAACVTTDADAFSPAAGLRNPGARQLDENIADLAGLRLAYVALAALPEYASSTRHADGRSSAQQFFYAFAQARCLAQTPDDLARSLDDDSHAPAEYRVNGPLANLPAFAEAFSCRDGEPMTRRAESLCQIW